MSPRLRLRTTVGSVDVVLESSGKVRRCAVLVGEIRRAL